MDREKLKEAVETSEDLISSLEYYEKDKPEYVEAIRNLQSLAEEVLAWEGKMPNKKIADIAAEVPCFSSYNEAISDCTAAIVGALPTIKEIEHVIWQFHQYIASTRLDYAKEYVREISEAIYKLIQDKQEKMRGQK